MATFNYTLSSKGEYDNGKNPPVVHLKQYVILKNKKEKLLSLRFYNGLESSITRIEFILFQLDSAGNVIKSARIREDISKAAPARTFAMPSGIKLSDKCVDFKVQMVEARCGKYAYSLIHRESAPVYKMGVKWKYDYEGQMSYGDYKVSSKMKTDYTLIKLLAIVAILSAAYVCVEPVRRILFNL